MCPHLEGILIYSTCFTTENIQDCLILGVLCAYIVAGLVTYCTYVHHFNEVFGYELACLFDLVLIESYSSAKPTLHHIHEYM